MDLSDLLEAERINCHSNVQSKKRALQTLAELLGESLAARAESLIEAGTTEESAENGNSNSTAKSSSRKPRLSRKPDDNAEENIAETPTVMQILDALISRERLGSTGLGHGVGLPHSRLANIQEPIAAFITLEKGVDYESIDGKPVDLVFGLLVPEQCNDEHLKILAQLAKQFSDEKFRDSVRSFTDANQLYDHLISLQPSRS